MSSVRLFIPAPSIIKLLPDVLFILLCRLKDTCGSLSSVLLYFAFFLPTTLNTAWLSVATGVGILIVPESYDWDERHVEAFAVVLICLVTALGKALWHTL